MKNKSLIICLVILVITIIVTLLIFLPKKPGEHDEFAQCLTDAGLKMYGTDWCQYCKEQKKLFGKSFKLVDYINCDKNKETCLIEGVTRYPNWKINRTSYLGVQSFETLSELTGCNLNK